MTKISRTGRRWSFVIVGVNTLQIEELFKQEKRIRYATWYIIKKERTDARGYIELKTPLKQTGMRKILGETSIVCFAKKEREEIIKEVEKTKYIHSGPYSYGERILNKGGRPKKKPFPETEN